MNVQWYPGHMTKAMRVMREDIALVDIVIELLDARIPYSSRNPDIDSLCGSKPRAALLNTADLADPVQNERWAAYFTERGLSVILTDAASGAGLEAVVETAARLTQEKKERLKARGRLFTPTRAMIVGIPNVGKSTFINRLVGKSVTKTADKPGVTKGRQWIKLRKDVELLDTPGVLWPRFDEPEVGLRLAFTGAVKDDIMDIYTLSLRLIEALSARYAGCFKQRYGVDAAPDLRPEVLLEQIAKARGFLMKGAEPDVERAAITLLDEFRGGKLGRITLETRD